MPFEQFEPRHMLAATNMDGYFSVLLDNAPGNVNASDGNLMLYQSGLVYSSRTVADAVVEIRAALPAVNGNRPTDVTGIFTFPGQTAQTYEWDVDAGAQIGEEVVFRVPVSIDPLATGRYAWTLDTTYYYNGNPYSPPDYTGHYLHVDRSSSEFGKGWYHEDLARLKLESNGFLLINGDGERYWFNYSGGSYVREAGDPMFYTVTEDASYLTLTNKFGSSLSFLKNAPTGWARLESEFDASGNEREFNYDGSNRLQSILDVPTGNTTTFSYAGGLLTSITETVGIRSRLMAVNMLSGQISSMMLPDSDDFSSSGGSNGPLLSPLWEYAYSGTSGLLTKVVDPVGNITQHTYGVSDAVTSIKQDSQTTTLVPFKSHGLGGTQSFPGLLKDVADAVGELKDEMNHDTVFCMNMERFVTEFRDDLGNLTKYERNSENLVTRMVEPDPDDFTLNGGTNGPMLSLETTYAYDLRGNMTRETKRALGSTTVSSQRTWEYPNPDDYSLPTKYVDELGRVTKYTIGPKNGVPNDRGKILSMVQIVGLEDNSQRTETDDAKTTYSYTTVAGHVGLVEKITDALGRVTRHEYFTADPHEGLLSKIIYNDGAQLSTNVRFEYGDFRNRTRSFDELNRQTDFTFDRLDRLIKRVDPDPDAKGPEVVETEFAFDPAGNLIRTIDPLDNVTSTIYDARHRVAEQILPRPEFTSAQVELRDEELTSRQGTWTLSSPGYAGDHFYQAAGAGGYAQWSASNLAANKRYEVFVTWQENPLNASDALYEVRDANDTVLDSFKVNQQRAPTYEYDSANNVWWQPLGTFFNKTTLKVRLLQNATGRVVADAVKIVEVGPATLYEYDEAGNLKAMTDALGNTTNYEYDELNRLKLVRQPSPDGVAPRPETETAYWADGAVKQVTDPLENVTQYNYDALARNTEVIHPDPDGPATGYTSPLTRSKYDAAGQMTYITQTDGAATLSRTTQYTYDGLGRQSAMIQPLPVGTPAEIKVNNQTTPPTGWTRDTTSGYQGDHLWRDPDPAGAAAEWSFTGLDTTKTYAVYATWVVKNDVNNLPLNASNARYEVLEGTLSKARFSVNQKYGPADELTDTNINWSRLGLLQAHLHVDDRSALRRRRRQAGRRWRAAGGSRPSHENDLQQAGQSRHHRRSLGPRDHPPPR